MDVAIRRADRNDRELVVRVLDEAFQGDPVSGWVFPGEEHRRATHHRLMAAFADTVLAEGRIDLVEDGTACALWLPVPAAPVAESAAPAAPAGAADEAETLRQEVDPENGRVELIARLMAEAHPADRAHEYLWMIGVVPGHQGRGLGTALIRPVLERCDREGLPAYLEASSPRSVPLYERLGFAALDRTLDLPDGPRMWPMWREPRG
ncbi:MULTISPECIES: GNAT family N-acetyltransferase [Streptomyces]|uniref:GNAT family N-acetyltransferase n=1 Tax=Streptomyces TaxID=1883 RepID=UPI001F17E758|nr:MULTISPECIES: GNAT family N-acetyltransferase [unclassified Streptomyces]MCF0088232.1 Mycothiol acetyltransferase [Streptomyces sp. MH192]MCF0101101.1 Mycothiol acetyltransferase [Streptomyces sp. MH191]